MNGEEIGIVENEAFGIGSEWGKLGKGFWLFFAEIVEVSFPGGGGGVVGSLNWLRVVVGILHVVGENHELGGVDEATKFRVLEASVDSISFRENAIAVVGLFHLDEGQGNAVDEEGDIGPEFFVAISTGEFSDNVEGVFREVLEIDDGQRG